jgi:hypothetical protein
MNLSAWSGSSQERRKEGKGEIPGGFIEGCGVHRGLGFG